MTVRDLIDELLTMDQDATIKIPSPTGGYYTPYSVYNSSCDYEVRID